MQLRYLILLGVLAVAPASAQPFRFPLQPQPQPQEQAAPPASAPPIAPPQAGPSLPPATGFAARPTEAEPGQQEEEAYQPPPAPDTQSPAPPR